MGLVTRDLRTRLLGMQDIAWVASPGLDTRPKLATVV